MRPDGEPPRLFADEVGVVVGDAEVVHAVPGAGVADALDRHPRPVLAPQPVPDPQPVRRHPPVPVPEVITIRRTLNRASFLSRLHEAVANLTQQFPTLSAVTVSISR